MYIVMRIKTHLENVLLDTDYNLYAESKYGITLLCELDDELQVSKEDHGRWMCLINDNQEFNSIKQYLTISVGVVPKSGVILEGNDLYDDLTETVVEVVEGETIRLSCYANGGYPPANIRWEYKIYNESHSVSEERAVRQSSPLSPLVTVSRTLLYMATLQDHNNTLTCQVSQTHRVASLYTRTMRVNLTVRERRPAQPLVSEMTIISGVVVITTIPLLFCLVLVLLTNNRRSGPGTQMPLVYRWAN